MAATKPGSVWPPNIEKGGDITSASPLVIDTDGNYFDVTGTTGYSAMTVGANRRFTLQFDGVLTMTHHATNLDLPGEANITTAAGDVAEFFSTGSNTVQCVNYTKADGTSPVAGGLPTRFFTGLTLSNDTDTDHDINVTAGAARDSTDAADLTLAAEQTKQLDASWATGDDAGGLSSSLTIAADTWYHCFLCTISGTVEIGFDTSVTAANLVSDHSATTYRLIGSVMTDGSANLDQFDQIGNRVYWDAQHNDYASTAVADGEFVFSAPLGYQTTVSVACYATGGSSQSVALLSPVQTSRGAGQVLHSGASNDTSRYILDTDTSSQLTVSVNIILTAIQTTTDWFEYNREII